MKLSVSNVSRQIQPLLNLPPSVTNYFGKEKVVVVVGATGTGKSRLSIDLATRFTAAEVINSDKIQAFEGLEVTTNKITDDERRGVRHHLLGVADPESDFSAASFRAMASASIQSILGRDRLPIIAGGSNSFVEGLITDPAFQTRYECCFLWVHVEMPVLHSFVSSRVDRMVKRGMVEEVRHFYSPNGDYSTGIRRAIGVPEFDEYFRREKYCDGATQRRMMVEAIESVKRNTNRLAFRQLEKIRRLRLMRGWKMHRLDATNVFRKRGGGETGEEEDEAWERLVAGPATAMVSRFLCGVEPMVVAIRGGVGATAMMETVSASR